MLFLLLTNYPTFCQQKSEVLFALGFLLSALLEENFGAKSVRRRRPHRSSTKREEREIVDKRWGNLSTMSCAGGDHAGNGAICVVNDIDRVKSYVASGFINVAGRNEFRAFCGIQILYGVADAYRGLLCNIAGNRQCEIGERENGAAHDGAKSISMNVFNVELAYSVSAASFHNAAMAYLCGELIGGKSFLHFFKCRIVAQFVDQHYCAPPNTVSMV